MSVHFSRLQSIFDRCSEDDRGGLVWHWSEPLAEMPPAEKNGNLRQLTCQTVSSTVPSTHFTTAQGRSPSFGRAGLPQIFSISALMS
jgi:hypothetical protein